VFHISQLKKSVGDYAVESSLQAELEAGVEEIEEPKAILAARDIYQGDQRVRQWLVRWKGRSMKDTTWEDEALLRSQFPDISLEDKAAVSGGGNDRTPSVQQDVYGPNIPEKIERPRIWQVYSRRKKVGPTS